MSKNFKRVNVLIREEHHELVNDRGLSLSGLVRDLLDDRFSDSKIILSVDKDTKQLYDRIISNFGIDDNELAVYLIEALDKFLASKSKEIDRIRKSLKR